MTSVTVMSSLYAISPIGFCLAFLQTRLPCSDPTTDDKNNRAELAVETWTLELLVVSSMNAVNFLAEAAAQ